jgi:hypothetical protein
MCTGVGGLEHPPTVVAAYRGGGDLMDRLFWIFDVDKRLRWEDASAGRTLCVSVAAGRGVATGVSAMSSVRGILVLILTAAGLAFGGAVLAGPAVAETLTPPPPSFLSCNAVGGGTICRGSQIVSYGPEATGIVCASGASAFEIFDTGAFEQRVIRFYDSDGNLTRRVIHNTEIGGEWSNPVTGATVSYTQNYVTTDVLAVPGDLASATSTTRGEVIIRAGTGAPVLIAVGRQVFSSEGDLISSAGRNAFVAAAFEGDTSAFDAVCGALA